jgi:hypothetical protein
MKANLKLTSRSDMFGTSYTLVGEEFNSPLTTVTETNVLDRAGRVLKSQAYWFRAPAIDINGLDITLRMLDSTDGKFQLEIARNDEKIEASLKFAEEGDAQLFAWQATEIWQKWSSAEEAENKKGSKRPKIKVTKDGRIRAKISVSTIDGL